MPGSSRTPPRGSPGTGRRSPPSPQIWANRRGERAAAAIGALDRPVDVLVNNAGTAAFVPFLEADRARYDHSVALTVTAPFFLTQALVPLMPADGASVINIS